jgi:hypothetical protein
MSELRAPSNELVSRSVAISQGWEGGQRGGLAILPRMTQNAGSPTLYFGWAAQAGAVGAKLEVAARPPTSRYSVPKISQNFFLIPVFGGEPIPLRIGRQLGKVCRSLGGLVLR